MRDHPLFQAYLALASVCFFWGTTYAAIRMSLETVPPLLLVAARFCLSGSLMLGVLCWRRKHIPRGRELLRTAFHGVLILGVGNGCLVYSELWIPSSLAALFIAISPFWMVGLEALVPGGEPLRAPVLAGIALGFLGAAILVAPGLLADGISGNVWRGFLILQLGSASWSLGSILEKRHRRTAHPVVSGAVQQLAAGLAFAIPAGIAGETPAAWQSRGTAALLYLVVFGSIVGYSAYIYALDRLPVSLVSIYGYVNPVVAAILGWLLYREPFGGREITAMAIIFAGVAVVKRGSRT